MSRRSYQKISEELKDLIISAHVNHDYSYKYMSETYNVKISTVKAIISRYKKFGRAKKARGHRKSALTSEQCEQLNEWVEEDCQRTLADYADLVEERFSIRLSEKTIHNYLKKLLITFKRISTVPERRNCPSTIETRYDYAMSFFEMDEVRDKVFFVDECGIAVHCRYNYGRSKKGERANLKVKAVKGKNFSVCAAMNHTSLTFYEVMDTPYDHDHFLEWMDKFFSKLSEYSIENAFIVMDNVRFHHCASVREKATTNGHKIVFLPPYSPFLNPIEQLFNQLKFYVKRLRPQTPEEVFSAVHHAAEVISEDDCKNYYNHMRKNVSVCIRKEPILN